jgi:CDP-4-dehydro-6-deoxyglucose reductase
VALADYHAKVSKIRDLTHDVREITLHLIDPPTIPFKAGQFISFDVSVPGYDRPGTRPYSIASVPRDSSTIELVLNLVPGGPGSTYLFGLHLDQEVAFRGPAGSFYLREDSTRDVLFVATGTGIAPIRSMIKALIDRSDSRPVTLFWGLRSERDLYYQEELASFTRQLASFRYVVTLSRPKGIWQGSTGRVTQLVDDQIKTVHNLEAYLCGNSGMIKDVTALLRERGLCPIYREKYYDDQGNEEE